MKGKICDWYKELRIYYNKILGVKGSYQISLSKRINMNFKGFIADQYVRYSLSDNNIGDYISEVERWKTRRINGRYNLVADDRLVFSEIFEKYVNVPENVAWIKDGIIYNFVGGCFSDNDFFRLLHKQQKLVVKPTHGSGGGNGVHVIKKVNDNTYIDERLINKDKLLGNIRKLDDYIIIEFVDQHEYSNNIFNKTTNTIRIITVINPQNGTAFITDAVHRIGLEASIPVDNASKGALVARIDINTGIIGKAKTYFNTTILKNHPNTGALIEGVQIPFWETVKNQIIEVAQKFPYIYFIAWDIVITPNSFCVIEINASTSLDLLQIWEGKKNSQLGNFYRQHNIFK